MKPSVFIGLIAILSSIDVDGYGVKNRNRQHGFHHHKPQEHDITRQRSRFHDHRSPWDSTETNESDSAPYSRPDSGPDSGPYSKPDSSSESLRYRESDSGPESWDDSRLDDSDDYDHDGRDYDWRDGGRRPCQGSRCNFSTTRRPWRTINFRTTRPEHTRPTSNWWRIPPRRPPAPTQNWLTAIPNTAVWWETTTSRNLSKWPPYPTRSTSDWNTKITTWRPRSTRHTTPWTTTPSQETDITTENLQEETTVSQDIIDCINNCPSTPEYNPMCGTDGVTYDNIGKLFCAKNCGINVELRRKSVCPPPPPPDYDDDDDDDETTTSPRPTTTRPPISTWRPTIAGRTAFLTSYHSCMMQCRIILTYSPVCGSDLETYINIDRFNCAKDCGHEIDLLCAQPCAICGATKPETKAFRPTVRTILMPDVQITTREIAMDECIKTCPVTSEHNPVCGTNRVTYYNPGHLLCAQLCGNDVRVARLSACSVTTTTESVTNVDDYDYEETTLAPSIEACTRRCPVTSEYNPICGTNHITYWNPGRLECAKLCGIAVEIRSRTSCEADDGPQTTTSRIPTMTTEWVYPNQSPLTTLTAMPRTTSSWTTPRTSPRTTPITTSWTTPITTLSITQTPTTSNPTSSPTTTRRPFTSPTTTDSTSVTIDFTIPRDILFSIFGTLTNTPTTEAIKSTTADGDEPDIDFRFGNETEERTYLDPNRIIFPE